MTTDKLQSPTGPQGAFEASQARDVDRDLEAFRTSSCPEIDAESMQVMITTGEQLIQTLREAAKNPDTWHQALANPEVVNKRAAIALMWAMTKMTAHQGQLFVLGSTRIGSGEPLSAEKMEEFFCACGGAKYQDPSQTRLAGGDAYFRISSHMKESLQTGGGPQRGLDLLPTTDEAGNKFALPAGRKTILFARLHDGTFFIKMESQGVPPFWKKGFRSWKNFAQFLRHGLEFIRTRPALASVLHAGPESSELPSRKEHVSQQLKTVFREFLRQSGVKTEKSEVQQAERHGISAMIKLVTHREQGHLRTQLYGVTGAPPEGYEGEVKGHEVLLPNLSRVSVPPR